MEMVEHQLKGICYNYNEKYCSRNKCKEKKLLVEFFEVIIKMNLMVKVRTKSLTTLRKFLFLTNSIKNPKYSFML
jgi:hypothetical protein